MAYKYDNFREDIIPFIPPMSKTILDVGCGSGKLLKILQTNGKDCYGIEPNDEGAKAAISYIGENKIINKKIENAINDLPERYFDAILFLDVLEHLVEPSNVLIQIKSKLNENGIVIASIPNIRYFHTFYELVVKREFDYKEYGVMDKTHLRFFTYKSMRKLFEEAGYSIINIQGINPTPSKKLKLLNLLTLGFFTDCKYQQFVIVSKPK